MKQTLTIILLLIMALGVQAQVMKNLGGQRAGISALSFLKQPVSPRADAMAGSQISAHGNAYSPNWNPAGMTDLTQLSFAASDKLLPADIHNSYFAAVIPTEDDGVWGGSITMLNAGEMKKRTAFQPDGTGQTFSAYNMAIGVSFARKLSDRFSLGGRGQYVREQLAEFTAHTAVMDLGFLYKVDVQDLRFAVTVKNFGPNSEIDGPFDKTTVSNNGNGSANNLNDFPTPTVFQLGISMRIFENAHQGLRGHLQLNHPNDNAENLALGLDYQVNEVFFLRGGYKVPSEAQNFPSGGMGVKFNIGRHPVQLDYAVNPRLQMGLVHNLGVKFSINKETR